MRVYSTVVVRQTFAEVEKICMKVKKWSSRKSQRRENTGKPHDPRETVAAQQHKLVMFNRIFTFTSHALQNDQQKTIISSTIYHTVVFISLCPSLQNESSPPIIPPSPPYKHTSLFLSHPVWDRTGQSGSV